MKAFILCSGLGTRARPWTHYIPKAAIPFLNLPLLSYTWFYMEQMGLSEVVCNSHLFPKTLQATINFLSDDKIKNSIVYEPQCLDSAGGLYNVKSFLETEKEFLYLNADSLFFPSSLKKINDFKEDFSKSQFECSFFTAPVLNNEDRDSALWIDKDHIVRHIGAETSLPKNFSVARSLDMKNNELRPVKFSGLALFKNQFLKTLNGKQNHIFKDVMNHYLSEGRYKTFVDEKSLVLEAGEIQGYIEATGWALDNLFLKLQHEDTKSILEKVFNRFDPEDKKVGFQLGLKEFKKTKLPLLAPESVKGLEHLNLKGFAVIGANVHLTGKSDLKDSVLNQNLCWKGSLENQLLI